jgi:hypothetical protein
MHPTVLRGVLSAAVPNQAGAISRLNDDQLSTLGRSISTLAPPVARALAAPGPENNATVENTASQLPMGQVAAQAAASLLATGEAAKWGRTGAMNPISAAMRRKTQPVKILPASVTTNAQGTGQLTFTPQEPFEGFRICVPSSQGNGYISQLTAGDRLMVAQSGRIPFACLNEKSDVGRIDFPLVSLGEVISAQISGATANTEIGAVIIGYGSRPRVLPQGSEILYQRFEPFDVTADGGAATATITLAPQRHVIIRRIAFDDTVANFSAGIYVTSINVQDLPQFVGNVEIPAQLFSELAVDDWLDFDLCQLGGTITIGLRNANANAINVQGVAEVDVVRMPGEPRR